MALPILRTTEGLRARVREWRYAGESVGLVPTMGALHEGHLSLVRLCRAANARTCVTIFVNPAQFAPGEDLERYPRDEAADARLLEDEGVDALYAPDVGDVYGPGFATRVTVGALGDDLEGAFRPGFFEGIATVVTKLLMKALPDTAFFGEKDYQQLVVIRRLVADLDIPVAIEAAWATTCPPTSSTMPPARGCTSVSPITAAATRPRISCAAAGRRCRWPRHPTSLPSPYDPQGLGIVRHSRKSGSRVNVRRAVKLHG